MLTSIISPLTIYTVLGLTPGLEKYPRASLSHLKEQKPALHHRMGTWKLRRSVWIGLLIRSRKESVLSCFKQLICSCLSIKFLLFLFIWLKLNICCDEKRHQKTRLLSSFLLPEQQEAKNVPESDLSRSVRSRLNDDCMFGVWLNILCTLH